MARVNSNEYRWCKGLWPGRSRDLPRPQRLSRDRRNQSQQSRRSPTPADSDDWLSTTVAQGIDWDCKHIKQLDLKSGDSLSRYCYGVPHGDELVVGSTRSDMHVEANKHAGLLLDMIGYPLHCQCDIKCGPYTRLRTSKLLRVKVINIELY